MSYQRVLPRDLFNEAKLLKCIGHLCLQIHDQKVDDLEFEQSGFDSYGSEVDGFDIELKEALNGLYISNIEFTKPSNGRLLNFYTTYNSKAPYPLFCYDFDENVEIEVFDDNGVFTEEFLHYLKNK